MKKYLLYTLSFIVLSLGFISTSYAYEIDIPDSMIQGNTVRIDMQRLDILTATISFAGDSFRFFPVISKIDENTLISKREFLKNLYANETPPTGEQFSYTIFDVPKTDPDYALFVYAFKKGVIIPSSTKMLSPDGPYRPASSSSNSYFSYKDAEKYLSLIKGKSVTITRPLQTISMRSYIAPHRTEKLGKERLILTYVTRNGTKGTIEKDINITAGSFRVSRFSMSADRYALFGKESQDSTWTLVDNARKSSNAKQLWTGAFIVPVKGEVTSKFGDLMYINGKFSGSHFGIDYAAPTGTSVVASNTGKVVLSEYTPAFGDTIIIDHGQDIFTMYIHLSKRMVEKGQNVTKGNLIGKVGNSGISTGPHLHFTFFAKDVIVNNKDWTDGKFE